MATQISELTVTQKHWLKELNDMEAKARSHLESFELASGVSTDALNESKLLLMEAYAKARMAVALN